MDNIDELFRRRQEKANKLLSDSEDIDRMESYGDLAGLAQALSNMSSSAGRSKAINPGTFGIPAQTMQQAYAQRAAKQRLGEDMLLEDLKLSPIVKQQQRAERVRMLPVSDTDRGLINSYLGQFDETLSIPVGMTYGDIEDNPYLSTVLGQIKPERKGMDPMDLFNMQFRQKEFDLKKQELAANRALKEEEAKKPSAQELAKKMKKEEELTKAGELTNYLTSSIDELTGLINQYGTSEQTNQAIDARMQALASDLRLEMKELKNLGVLNGPDLAILQEQIPPVGGFAGLASNKTRALAKLKEARALIQKKYQLKIQGISGTNTPTFPRTLRKGSQEVTVSNEAELREAQQEGWQ